MVTSQLHLTWICKNKLLYTYQENEIGDKQVNVYFGFMYGWTAGICFIFKSNFIFCSFWRHCGLTFWTAGWEAKSLWLTVLPTSDSWSSLCFSSTPGEPQSKNNLTESISYVASHFQNCVSRAKTASELLGIYFCMPRDRVALNLLFKKTTYTAAANPFSI